MKNKNINVSLITWIIIGFLILPMILGGIYLYNLQGLTVRKNPDKSKETDVFEIEYKREIATNDNDEKGILSDWSFDNDRYIADVNSMLTMRDDCQIIKHFQQINDKRYSKNVTVMQHAPKILVDRKVMSSAQKLIKFSNEDLNYFLNSYYIPDSFLNVEGLGYENNYGIPYIEADRLKFNAFKSNDRRIYSSYILKKGENLQTYEKSAYDQYKDTVYNQIYVNNTIYYVEVNEKDYKLISKEEFKEKAYGFDQSTDLEKLIKKTSKIPERYVWVILMVSMLATVAIYYTYQNFKYGKHIFAFLETMMISAFTILAWYKFTIFGVVAVLVDIILLKLVYKNIVDEIEFKPMSSWQFILLGYVIGVILNRNI